MVCERVDIGGAADLPEGVPVLTSLYLYITSGCNLRCRHCWITPTFVDGKPSPGTYLELGLLRQAVEEARPLGLLRVKLTGGEPLLHPQFTGIVDFIAGEGLALTIETNGTLLDTALARHLRERAPHTFVSVSLDGPGPESHDPFRGVDGSFDAAVRGIRALIDAGFHPQIITSIYRGNAPLVEKVVKLAVELGAESVKFNPVTRTGRGTGMHERDETLDLEEILRLAHFVRGELQDRTPIPLIVDTPLAFYSVRDLVRARRYGLCHVRHILGILSDGEMALCGIGRHIPELCFGRVGEVGVAEVWLHHPTLERLREELDGEYPGVCGQCIHVQRCLAYCVAQNYVDTGRLVAPPWMCDEAYRRGICPAGRLREGK